MAASAVTLDQRLDLSNYTQTVPAEPGTPSTSSVFDPKVQYPFIKEIVEEGYIEEPTLQREINAARSFFTGQSLIKSDVLINNIKFGQVVKVIVEKDQNPLGLYQSEAIEYDDLDSCHEIMTHDCTVPCINTLPEFDSLNFRFDTEYAYGVRMCDKDKDFWSTEFYTKQYSKSRAGYLFGREVDTWNTVMARLKANAATTVAAEFQAAFPTHFWEDLGTVTAAARTSVAKAVYYMTSNFDGLNLTGFATPEFATELIASVETPYNVNFETQRVNTFEQWDLPGFEISSRVKEILGVNIPVVIMKRSPWLSYTAGGSITSRYPLWNADGTKQYFAILDPRVGYSFEKEGYHLDIVPYDCDKLYRGMIDTVYTGSGITFPQYGLLLEFDAHDFANDTPIPSA